MDYKVHIAFGFHVNCYHSYRGDTNDNLGFGSDIRIIRKILDTLTDFNKAGVPVKGTWDCENFFSLERILPEYAPDIIEKMKERVEKYGDEQIIMGYSNGALGAMNDEEFTASIEKAVTNEQGSGLADIFGKYEKIVRPQEVMFTPSQVSLYNKLGVKALCLYYSCVPFDAFRTIVPQLPDELAFNPLTYTYKDESMTVIPTYNNSDICDAGCLRAWVKELHGKQENGEINHDVFLFVNMDADAIFWESMNLPVVGNKIANTDGIHGLVEEIADLDYIVFDTPAGYLANHEALGNINFTHDTADGNFTGYASWAEKPYNRKIWTSIERARAMSKVNAESDENSPSFQDRVLLLSTTHFGLATPVLNIQREKKADELAESIINSELAALEKSKDITVHNINGTTLQCVQLKINGDIDDISRLEISGSGLKDFAAVYADSEKKSIFLILRFDRVKKKYIINASLGEKKKASAPEALETAGFEIRFSSSGTVLEVFCGNKKIGDNGFIESFITYGGRKYSFRPDSTAPLACAGSAKGIRLSGDIHLPGEIESGHFDFDFFTAASSPAVFMRSFVKYPHTSETSSISTENSSLGRYSDMKWQEAAMLQFTPKLSGDTKVIKRNFSGDISSFRTRSFPECDEKNKKLASFNHQLSAGMVGLENNKCALIIANSRQVLCSMAHCPMRLDADGTVHMNMFGSYYGKQRHHRSRTNGAILDTYTLVTPQGKSIAPSYNGNSENAVLALFGFSKGNLTENDLKYVTAFADGAVVTAPENALLVPFIEDNVKFKETAAQQDDEKKLKNPILTGISGNLGKYAVYGSRAIAHIIKSQIKSK